MTRRRGFALLTSLWCVVAITALAFEVARVARGDRLATANAMDATHAHAAATAGIEHARALLTTALRTADPARGPRDPWLAVVGRGDSVPLDGASYTLTLRDDGATLDVNRADADALRALFIACGADAPMAARSASRVMDFIDADSLSREDGSEAELYRAADGSARPRNAPLLTLDALDGIPDLPAAPWRCARSVLSIGGMGRINPNSAPAPVLRTVPGVSAEVANAIIAARTAGTMYVSFNQLLDAIPGPLAASLRRVSDRAESRLTFQVDAVRVLAHGTVPGSPVAIDGEALLTRGGGATVFVTWSTQR